MYKIFSWFLLVLVFLGFDKANSQTWTRTLGGLYDDCGYSLCMANDGGYVLTGYTGSYGDSMTDVWLIKTDSAGLIIWDKTFGGPDSECAYSIQATSDSGYVIAGYTKSFGSGGSDAWVLKTDINGDTLWSSALGDSFDDCAYYVTEAVDYGYVVVGSKDANRNLWIIKIDTSGNTLWTRTFQGWGCGRCIQKTQDSCYIVTGYIDTFDAVEANAWLMKLGISGDSIWAKIFEYPGNDYVYSVRQIEGGEYIISGSKHNKILLVRTDSSGNITQDYMIFSYDSGVGYSVSETENSRFIIAGCLAQDVVIVNSYGPDYGTYEIFGGNEGECAYSLLQISDSSYIMIGYTESYGEGEKDLWLIRTNENTWDWYSPVMEEVYHQKKSSLLISVTPNPIISLARITFYCEPDEEVKIALYDITGREVMLLYVDKAIQWKNIISMNTKGLQSGKYFLRMETKNASVTEGIIVLN